MSDELDGLPRGWRTTTLREIAEIVGGVTKDTKKSQGQGFREVPYLRVANVQRGRLDLNELKLIAASEADIQKLSLQPGDLLLNEGGDRDKLGRGWIWQGQLPVCIHQNHVFRARLQSHEIDPIYIAHFANSMAQSYFAEHGSQTTNLASISLTKLGSLPIQLPPPREQTRIVAKLEELLSDLDAGVAELKAAQKKLAQYRQSLLKAAVTGELTAKWRAAHALFKSDEAENGQQLLQRILTERRARWEAKQLAKFKAQGKTPPKDSQKKYPEPVQPDTTGLPELPEGWVYASLDQLLLQLRSGSAETSSRETTDFPVLKSSAVRPGSIDYSALNYLTLTQSRIENRLESGDLLISRLSGSVEYVGCCAQVFSLPAHGVQYPDRLFCGKLVTHTETLGAYIVISVSSPYARAKIEKAAKSTAGHKRISLSDLHPFAIALPPLQEAQELIRLMDIALSEIAQQESAVRLALKQSTAQRQNILRAAFAGQLVPQDPNDEPASVLLARIRTERAQREAVKKPRSRKPKGTA